jgi:hypothetical protein
MRMHVYISIIYLSIPLLIFSSILPVQVTSIWDVQIIDKNSAGYGNSYTPIVVDSNDDIHLAYTGHSPPNFYNIARYATPSISGWSIQEIPYGTTIDLALDSKGNPHILYETGVYGGLIYSSWTGEKWIYQEITESRVIHGSLALDSFDNPHIAYKSGEALKYASRVGIKWEIQTIDSIVEGSVGSLTIDSNNTPYILYSPFSYTDFNKTISIRAINVRIARCQNTSWNIQTIPLPPPTGDIGNMILDSKGYPHFIATQHHFVSDKNMTILSTILHVNWNGTFWEIQKVVSDTKLESIGFLALDSRNYPHLTYTLSTFELEYASWTGTEWNIQPIDTKIQPRGPCYLAIDSKDNPHISYRGIGANQTGSGRFASIIYATANTPDFTQLLPPYQAASLPFVLTVIVIVIIAVVILLFKKTKPVRR